MNKSYFVLGAYICAVLAGCQSHSHEGHEGHDHEGHAHTAHEHESHDHAEHAHEEGHSHEGHDHAAEVSAGEHVHAEGDILFSEEQAKAVGLEVETIVSAPFTETLKVSGQVLTPTNKSQSVVAATEGVIVLQRILNEGSAVRKGEVLAHISVEGMASANPVETARIQYETARKEYERAIKLVDNQIVSAQEMEQITLRYETTKATYEAMKSRKTADGSIAIIAPQDGYISGMTFTNGDYVGAGQNLFTINQTRDLLLQVDVPERHWRHLSAIRSANFVPAYSEETYCLSEMSGKLLSVGRVATQQAGYVPVVFSFENTGELIAGTYADVYLLLTGSEESLSVPVSAVTEEQGLHHIYIQLNDHTYKKREVALGQSNGERVRIIKGLQAGERVVTRGVMQVRLAGSATIIPGHSHNH